MKICSKCDKEKDESEFNKDKNRKDGLIIYCRECHKLIGRTWYKAHPEGSAARHKLYRQRNPDKIKAYNDKWAKDNPKNRDVIAFKSVLKTKYDITPEIYYEILDKQNKVCAICKKVQSEFYRLQVDHDHKTSKVRGLLCGKCNRSLGLLDDSIENLESAIKYLKGELHG